MSVTPAKTLSFSPVYFIPDYFSLSVSQAHKKTNITMKLFNNSVNTSSNPKTYALLQKYLPTILHSMCFNDEGLPFSEEVKHTELGHLFEHILLEYLCHYKLLKGYDEAIYNGNTKWNWVKESWGTFHIVIDSGSEDMDIFNKAVEDSITLMKKIMRKEHLRFN